MDQGHPSGDQAHEGCFIPHGIARDQLLVEPREGVERMKAQLRSEEVGMVMDALRNAKRFHVTVSLTTDAGLKDTTDLGGSSLLLFWDRRS